MTGCSPLGAQFNHLAPAPCPAGTNYGSRVTAVCPACCPLLYCALCRWRTPPALLPARGAPSHSTSPRSYWDIRGLGQPIRLALEYVGADFVDVRVHNGPGVSDFPLSPLFPSTVVPFSSNFTLFSSCFVPISLQFPLHFHANSPVACQEPGAEGTSFSTANFD